ncbi:DJ-1/PfpI family protein [Rhodoferax fermentans]|uniref:Thiamine biosynthesis protein ThiJ n=1 Tax=Rhodoferax fermentans TaxID=28066 RepID=A0A1T1AMY9_RHOFE|nr:DJ-1/PfpI family protein [Rhodoferax fermentans]MBK1684493.1 thiamine biosynthesis protein ThiJ [Rhodoferax fermentans]OOV05516.1 thiamine biosynthesis protein ThiJ [Rhodoferax fermentans]
MSAPLPIQVAILVFDAVEVLDFAGPYEVFTTASRVFSRRNPGTGALFEVTCVSRDGGQIQARAGLRVQADRSFADEAACDLLLVPGGVVTAPQACPATLDWISRTAAGAQISASVCTGAFLLAASGVLNQGRVTTHWEDVADLRQAFPKLEVCEGPRWIDNGALVTSAGISAGIDMCLHLVARLAGPELARLTARQMDYPWSDDATG